MTFLRLHPINGEDDTPQRLSLCDQLFIVLGYCGDQGQKDLA
jgi:hypothetical protein